MHNSKKYQAKLNRRRLLKIVALTGTGLGITTLTSNRLHWASPAKTTLRENNNSLLTQTINQLPLTDFEFEFATVNARGEIVELSQGKNQYFREDLGNGIILDMINLSGGKFIMGAMPEESKSAESETPPHEVNLSPFLIAKYPITQAQWRAISLLPKINHELNANPSYFQGDNLPVERVSWYDAVEFCQRLSQVTGKNYRLPTEAEWEYACRGGTTTPFAFGLTITSELANYFAKEMPYAEAPTGEYRQQTTPVGLFRPNPFGLFDLHGNVLEWCADHRLKNYQGFPNDGSAWQGKNWSQTRYRVLRGGSWTSEAKHCRSANRTFFPPDNRYSVIGFRVVLS